MTEIILLHFFLEHPVYSVLVIKCSILCAIITILLLLVYILLLLKNILYSVIVCY